MKTATLNFAKAFGLIATGGILALAGIYIGDTDDAPGAALLGNLLMTVMVAFGVRILRRDTY